MKKLILSVALLAGITFIACSDEDNVIPVVAYSGCQACEIAADSLSNLPNENYDVCVGASDTIVYVNGAYTGIRPERYFSLFCDNAYGEVTEPTNPGNNVNCVTCQSYVNSAGETIAASEVCRAADGRAIVAGDTLAANYDTYIATQLTLTTCQ
ncbi:hypothetical protein GR160_10050 [Flavobacterium sp. Sd200]|uniref:hypothetical protein n=1 Tax=Flavobacterium sp. Sd200 TaxID=2692211 RepID=UPI001367D37D|nr:hypothetical protein [Flavobacterium sp. Sd200]MXN91569.1 hypothetical protein [Flavobacterium sp. Sd200]